MNDFISTKTGFFERIIMPSGTLTGYTIHMPITLKITDHVYVKSSHGHVWNCRGRSTGGRIICSGQGNTDQADCLAQSKSEAGILYAVTGVCHQMANRILYPSGQTVSKARGYNGSLFIWGTYGKDPQTMRRYSPSTFPWPELSHCLANHTHP